MNKKALRVLLGILAMAGFAVVFIVPFLFIIFTALKSPKEAAELSFAPPTEIHLWDNLLQVLQARDYMVVISFINSFVLTVVVVTVVVILGSMVAFVLQRRVSKLNPLVNFAVLAGLIIPPAVVPTVWVLQSTGLFRTMPGLMLVLISFGLPFCVLMFRAFISTIPKELDEAAIVDGAGPLRLFFTIILPLLKPTVVTVVVTQSVAVFNDFTHPLYFLPGTPTAQLTLYNFQSQFLTQYNLLFMNILLITIPPLLVFLFFNRQMVAGMTAGAVKG